MNNEKKAAGAFLYSLIPLKDFMSILNIDDRDEKLARFCLVTSTLTIEQYCKRKFLKKQYFEQIEFSGSLFLPLREYPVCKILVAFLIRNEKLEMRNWEIIEPEFYCVIPDLGTDLDIPFAVELSPAITRFGCTAIKVVYWAGYVTNEKRKEKKEGSGANNEKLGMRNERRMRGCEVPADLAAACLELASWNMSRYKGRRVGMTGNIKGSGKEGEHFEMSMPENVKLLLEPYKRKLI